MRASLTIRSWSSVVLGTAMLSMTTPARAGVPECRGLRLEDVGSCEIRGNIQCEGGCSRLGIYKKACATKLQTVCREECTLSAEPTCTDECTVTCQDQCDIGLNITCIHNCFAECVGSCETSCQGSAKPEQCHASCEATCDGQCDIQCAPVVSGDCYYHCIECCGGSCGAQANMSCQTSCQDQEFETCEHELEIECQGSCTGSGALFCDDEYVLSSSEIPSCVSALAARGTAAVDLRASGEIDLDLGSDSAGGGCHVATPASRAPASAFLTALLGVLALGVCRRRRA